jgi:hypothetical protein
VSSSIINTISETFIKRALYFLNKDQILLKLRVQWFVHIAENMTCLVALNKMMAGETSTRWRSQVRKGVQNGVGKEATQKQNKRLWKEREEWRYYCNMTHPDGNTSG